MEKISTDFFFLVSFFILIYFNGILCEFCAGFYFTILQNGKLGIKNELREIE